MDGLFGDGLVDVLCCGGDSLEEDLCWGPRLGALVDLVEFENGVTNGGVALFKIVKALCPANGVSYRLVHIWFPALKLKGGSEVNTSSNQNEETNNQSQANTVSTQVRHWCIKPADRPSLFAR